MRVDPAKSIVEFLGGVPAVAAALKCNVSRVYRWVYPKGHNEGTGGYIPHEDAARLLSYAAENGIDLQPGDFFDASRLHPLLPEKKRTRSKAVA